MFKQITSWLGPFRTRLIVFSLITTGLLSLLLNLVVGQESWSLTAQTILVLAFLLIAALAVSSRLHAESRRKMFIALGPAFGLALLGGLIPNLFSLSLGAAFGWIVAAQIFMRDRIRMEYRAAIKLMRKQEYKEATQIISDLIKTDKDNPEHYQFRAQLYRLAGKLEAASQDYRRVINLAPEAASGYNGLSEVFLQMENYEEARHYAAEAYRLQPDLWVAPYNLGMIEDRLQASAAVVEHLQNVLHHGLPDSRHRLLTYLWLSRAHHRLGHENNAQEALDKLRQESKGLKEWETILEAEHGKVLRKVLEDDVELAQIALLDPEITPPQLFEVK